MRFGEHHNSPLIFHDDKVLSFNIVTEPPVAFLKSIVLFLHIWNVRDSFFDPIMNFGNFRVTDTVTNSFPDCSSPYVDIHVLVGKIISNANARRLIYVELGGNYIET